MLALSQTFGLMMSAVEIDQHPIRRDNLPEPTDKSSPIDFGEFDREAFCDSELGQHLYGNLDPNCPENFIDLYRLAYEYYQSLRDIGVAKMSPEPIPIDQFNEENPPTLDQLIALEADLNIVYIITEGALKGLAGIKAQEAWQDYQKDVARIKPTDPLEIEP
jgi:hypothetical protein